jgi:hypothetical protein
VQVQILFPAPFHLKAYRRSECRWWDKFQVPKAKFQGSSKRQRLRDAVARFRVRHARILDGGLYALIGLLLAFGIARLVFAMTSAPGWWVW